MRLDAPKPLGKPIEVAAVSRPIKIAYLVPLDDDPRAGEILDAVFRESYTRWAGAHTLVVPTSEEGIAGGYGPWLKCFDPDFVYTYVPLSEIYVKEIDALACPIAFILHDLDDLDEGHGWRQYLPNWRQYFQSVSSITTLPCPRAFRSRSRPASGLPAILTQSESQPLNRFIADNFGAAYSISRSSSPIDGLVDTLCLVEKDVPPYLNLGTKICKRAVDALNAVGEGRVIPIAALATLQSVGLERFANFPWIKAFRVVVGSTALDRVNFWNSRLLTSDGETLNSLIVPTDLADDQETLAALGEYLNKNNFLGFGGGPHQVEIHSASLSSEEVEEFRSRLARSTHSSIRVSPSSSDPVFPTEKDLQRVLRWNPNDPESIRLTQDAAELVASVPNHFEYMPPPYRGLMAGQWMVDLSIERHVSHSKYSNVVDHWQLPRRSQVAAAFTGQLAKPSRSGKLSLLPTSENFPLELPESRRALKYGLYLPSDENFFRYLVLGKGAGYRDDLRSNHSKSPVAKMQISDKGENLRGVIAMFESLARAYEVLTNRYWRDVLEGAAAAAVRPLSYELDKLKSLIPNDRQTRERVRSEYRLSKFSLPKLLEAGLMDAMDDLLRINVLHQVAHWRCAFCGHTNTRQFDVMKLENACDICRTAYFAPVDLKWNYSINEFVHRSLVTHSGLAVLWALGYLQERSLGVYWFLPETKLWIVGQDDPVEIDALCMVGGEFYAAEVKRSAESFVGDRAEIEKFARVISALRPDVALLAFTRYSFEGGEAAQVKMQLGSIIEELKDLVGVQTRFEVIVAEELDEFRNFPSNFGTYGPRLSRYLHELSETP